LSAFVSADEKRFPGNGDAADGDSSSNVGLVDSKPKQFRASGPLRARVCRTRNLIANRTPV